MKVKELFSDRSNWTQGAFARDDKNKSIGFDSPLASKWCLAGAIFKCYQKQGVKELIRVEDRILTSGASGIMSFGDSASYEQIMELVNELDI